MSTRPTRDELLRCLTELEALVDDRGGLAALDEPERRRFLIAAGRVSRPDRAEVRKLQKALRKRDRDALRDEDRRELDKTGIRTLRAMPVFPTPPSSRELLESELAGEAPEDGLERDEGEPQTEPRSEDAREGTSSTSGQRPLHEARKCYVCKSPFRELHHFYDQLCPSCAALNYERREQTADLHGRYALITGARVKIGYHASIKLLRAGAHVIVTTRFPHDAARRYAEERDHEVWGDRLQIFGLDLRHTPSVEAFASHLLATLPQLDFILNNACQTVRRPPGFYRHLVDGEDRRAALPAEASAYLSSYDRLRERRALPERSTGLLAPAELSQLALVEGDLREELRFFPEGELDQDLQQVDRRDRNSWRLVLHEVPTVELLEVQLVNAVAPFVLNARLKPLFLKTPTRDKHVVNVSAMEGQFYRNWKTDRHPHTNMAKAALNMLTRTSAADYVKDGIHMNSVDTGWITDEDPIVIAEQKTATHGFHPPLDVVDGAARIVDPIFTGFRTGEHVHGLFLKDYQPIPW